VRWQDPFDWLIFAVVERTARPFPDSVCIFPRSAFIRERERERERKEWRSLNNEEQDIPWQLGIRLEGRHYRIPLVFSSTRLCSEKREREREREREGEREREREREREKNGVRLVMRNRMSAARYSEGGNNEI